MKNLVWVALKKKLDFKFTVDYYQQILQLVILLLLFLDALVLSLVFVKVFSCTEYAAHQMSYHE